MSKVGAEARRQQQEGGGAEQEVKKESSAYRGGGREVISVTATYVHIHTCYIHTITVTT